MRAILGLLVAAALCGCSAGGNTPYGAFDFKAGPLLERKTTRKTTTIPDPASKAPPVVTDEVECEGGVCRSPR